MAARKSGFSSYRFHLYDGALVSADTDGYELHNLAGLQCGPHNQLHIHDDDHTFAKQMARRFEQGNGRKSC
jgi:hypothetical protein